MEQQFSGDNENSNIAILCLQSLSKTYSCNLKLFALSYHNYGIFLKFHMMFEIILTAIFYSRNILTLKSIHDNLSAINFIFPTFTMYHFGMLTYIIWYLFACFKIRISFYFLIYNDWINDMPICYTWVTWSPAGMCDLRLLGVWCCWEAIDGCDDLALLCLGLFSVGDCWSDFLITGLPLWLVMPPSEAIAPALLWSSVEPRRPWAWRGEEFLELFPLAISAVRSTKVNMFLKMITSSKITRSLMYGYHLLRVCF